MKKYKFKGDLVSETVKMVKSEILELMDETDNMVLDFNNTNYIDSLGLGMLVSLYKKSVDRNVLIKIENTNDNIVKLLKITALDELFDNTN